jgi:hypothetical protein
MRRWRLAVLVLPALVLAAIQAVVQAAPAAATSPAYPPSTGNLTVSATVVTVGDTVRVSGEGFERNTLVAISSAVVLRTTTSTPNHRRSPDCRATGRLCVVRADDAGRITATVRLTRPGTTAIVASGTEPSGATRVLSAVVLVMASSHRHQLAAAGRLDAGALNAPGGTGTSSSAVATRAAPGGAPAILPASLAAVAVLLAVGGAVAVRRRRHSAGNHSAGQ